MPAKRRETQAGVAIWAMWREIGILSDLEPAAAPFFALNGGFKQLRRIKDCDFFPTVTQNTRDCLSCLELFVVR